MHVLTGMMCLPVGWQCLSDFFIPACAYNSTQAGTEENAISPSDSLRNAGSRWPPIVVNQVI